MIHKIHWVPWFFVDCSTRSGYLWQSTRNCNKIGRLDEDARGRKSKKVSETLAAVPLRLLSQVLSKCSKEFLAAFAQETVPMLFFHGTDMTEDLNDGLILLMSGHADKISVDHKRSLSSALIIHVQLLSWVEGPESLVPKMIDQSHVSRLVYQIVNPRNW